MTLARLFLILGLTFIVVAGLFFLFARLELQPGRLPGDIRIQTRNLTCVFPLVTSILLSIVLTLILNLVIRFLNK